MTRLILVLALFLCIVGCPWGQPPPPPPESVVSVSISGDVGVEFDAEYKWSNGKIDTLTGVVREGGNGSIAKQRFHNGIPDDQRITALTIESLSGTGKLGVVIKRERIGENDEIVFEASASGEGAKISFNMP